MELLFLNFSKQSIQLKYFDTQIFNATFRKNQFEFE